MVREKLQSGHANGFGPRFALARRAQQGLRVLIPPSSGVVASSATHMNIVFIAHTFPPDRYVGAFRAAKVVDAFRAAGHHVDVITARGQGEQNRIRRSEPGLCVHTVPVIPNPRHAYVWAKHHLLKGPIPRVDPDSDSAALPVEPDRTRSSVWKRRILSTLWIPDDLQGFVLPAAARALPLVRRGADMIYTTAPPFSDHLVGWLLKKITGVRWVAEFRDPWTDNPERSPNVRSGPADRVNRWLERGCLAYADRVVAVAEATAELLAAKMPPSRRDRLVLALNGIDGSDQPLEGRLDSGPFRMVYAGTFHGGRDPRTFLTALAAFVERRGLEPGDLEVELIGRSRRYHALSVERYASDLGLRQFIRFVDWLPQETARQHMRGADMLLLFFRGHHVQIPNKLYDYLGARRPILAIVDSGAEVTRMLQRTGGHYVVTDEAAEAVVHALETAFQRRAEPFGGSDAVLREWSSESQMKHLLSSIAGHSGSSDEAVLSGELAVPGLRDA